jgi:hypothetical protein
MSICGTLNLRGRDISITLAVKGRFMPSRKFLTVEVRLWFIVLIIYTGISVATCFKVLDFLGFILAKEMGVVPSTLSSRCRFCGPSSLLLLLGPRGGSRSFYELGKGSVARTVASFVVLLEDEVNIL